MDPTTRDFVRINGKPYEREPLDAAWISALARRPGRRRAKPYRLSVPSTVP